MCVYVRPRECVCVPMRNANINANVQLTIKVITHQLVLYWRFLSRKKKKKRKETLFRIPTNQPFVRPSKKIRRKKCSWTSINIKEKEKSRGWSKVNVITREENYLLPYDWQTATWQRFLFVFSTCRSYSVVVVVVVSWHRQKYLQRSNAKELTDGSLNWNERYQE